MATYVLIPLSGCIVCALSALAVWLRDPEHTGNRLAALLIGGGAWWGACQLLWMVSGSAAEAVFYHKLAAPGWAFIGPLSLHLISVVTRHPGARIRRALPPLYAVGCLFAVIHVATPWLYRGAEPEPWGWGFAAGPLLPALLLVLLGSVIPAVGIGLSRVRNAPSPAERQQLRLMGMGIAVPFVFGTATGGILPLLGIPVPRLGPLSFAVLGVSIAWAVTRYGFSTLAPGSLSREIVETLPEGLALVGLDGRVISGNEQLARLLGVPVEQLPGHDLARALSIDIFTAIAVRETEALLAIASAEPFTVGVSTSPLRDKRGLAIGTVVVVRDLREVVALRDNLVTSGRLAAVGELAAGMAHEINNPIAFVRANLSQLDANWKELAARASGAHGDARLHALIAEGVELIQESIEGVDRTCDIVKDVRGFAHAGTNEHELVDLRELIDGVLRVARPELRFRTVVVEKLRDVPAVLGSPQELKQVFLNLIINASQAVDEQGTITISTHADTDHVDLRIDDDGCGIPEAVRERIFDPFFTTKPVGSGTGLGLAISYQIVRNHGAELLVESQPGTGTTFIVRFPRP